MQITNVTKHGVGAFTMDPWDFFFDQLTAVLTTDLKLTWTQNTTGLDKWAKAAEQLLNYFVLGIKSYGNRDEDLTKTG